MRMRPNLTHRVSDIPPRRLTGHLEYRTFLLPVGLLASEDTAAG